jgi:hypothetical protein
MRLKGEVGETVAISKKTDFSLSRLTDFGAFHGNNLFCFFVKTTSSDASVAFHGTDGGFVKKQ